MKFLLDSYNKIRKKLAPASKEDLEWRHNLLEFRLVSGHEAILSRMERLFTEKLVKGIRYSAGEPIFEENSLNIPRNEKILRGFSKEMLILEIGPSYSPVAAKKDGWNVKVIDHLSRADLIKKYTGRGEKYSAYEIEDYSEDNKKYENIEEVDFIWSGQDLDEIVSVELLGKFKACISSHNIEHTPNIIGFFQSMSKILTDDGFIVLAVPDKRYCFDFFRPHSTTGQVIEAYLNQHKKHSFASLCDSLLYSCTNNGMIDWGQKSINNLDLLEKSNPTDILDSARKEYEKTYRDCHGWQFTPASFCLIIFELSILDLVNFEVEKIFPSEGAEFIVRLVKKTTSLNEEEVRAKRVKLLRAIVEEMGVQADYQRAGSEIGNLAS